MLKLDVRSAQQLPRLKDIVLSVSAKDLHGKRYVSGVNQVRQAKQQPCPSTRIMPHACSLTIGCLSHTTTLGMPLPPPYLLLPPLLPSNR